MRGSAGGMADGVDRLREGHPDAAAINRGGVLHWCDLLSFDRCPRACARRHRA